MTNMIPLESSPLFGVFSYGGSGTRETVMIREETTNDQDSSGEAWSVSDPIAASNDYYKISSPPAKKADGSASKNDVVASTNIEDGARDKSWLRLGIGPEENNNTTSCKLQRCCSKNVSGGRDNSLELSLFTLSSTAEGTVSNSVDHPQPQKQPQQLPYNHHFFRPQTLLNRGCSFPFLKPLIPQYTAPFRPSSIGTMSERDVTNNNSVTRGWCEDEGGAGPSSEFRVIDPPKRPHSGLWFLLLASQSQ
ncbi:hypothetical protein HA466_0280870 [Hirschfeldia incana]|nr:hypothetical protein HA466_0280870 [Hirschfeldia incana]